MVGYIIPNALSISLIKLRNHFPAYIRAKFYSSFSPVSLTMSTTAALVNEIQKLKGYIQLYLFIFIECK